MLENILLIGWGRLAFTFGVYPGVVGYVNIFEDISKIISVHNKRISGNVDPKFHKGVIAIGKNDWKEEAIKHWLDKGYELGNLFHPLSYVDPRTKIGMGNVFMPFSYIDDGCNVGDANIIATHSCIHHNVNIGDYNHITLGVKLLPDVVIENSVFIGGNTTVLNKRRIGSKSVIGAHSVVNRDIPPSHKYICKVSNYLLEEII